MTPPVPFFGCTAPVLEANRVVLPTSLCTLDRSAARNIVSLSSFCRALYVVVVVVTSLPAKRVRSVLCYLFVVCQSQSRVRHIRLSVDGPQPNSSFEGPYTLFL